MCHFYLISGVEVFLFLSCKIFSYFLQDELNSVVSDTWAIVTNLEWRRCFHWASQCCLLLLPSLNNFSNDWFLNDNDHRYVCLYSSNFLFAVFIQSNCGCTFSCFWSSKFTSTVFSLFSPNQITIRLPLFAQSIYFNTFLMFTVKENTSSNLIGCKVLYFGHIAQFEHNFIKCSHTEKFSPSITYLSESDRNLKV